MRTIGIDLAVAAAHKAIVMESDGKFVTPVLSFHSRWAEIERLVSRAREGAASDCVNFRPIWAHRFSAKVVHSQRWRPGNSC
jgi:hypothetical protein